MKIAQRKRSATGGTANEIAAKARRKESWQSAKINVISQRNGCNGGISLWRQPFEVASYWLNESNGYLG
jgi:hypothetical protein